MKQVGETPSSEAHDFDSLLDDLANLGRKICDAEPLSENELELVRALLDGVEDF